MQRPLEAELALMQGTGGVSMFVVSLCLAAGIKPILTSSSDQDLEEVKELGSRENPVLGINYRVTPDWDEEAKKLTGCLGVDFVVNNVGARAMEKSINALVTRTGTISLVGFLGGVPEQSEMPDCVLPLLFKGSRMQ